MRTWLSLARLGGIALALGLFASATATAAGATTIYEVEPANVFAARGADLDPSDQPAPSAFENDDAHRRKRAREAAVETILGYNPFCDDCPEPVSTPGPGGTVPPATMKSTAPPNVQVLATMEALDPAKSLATIYDPIRGTRAAAVGTRSSPACWWPQLAPGS